MRIAFITLLIAAVGVIMFNIGKNSQKHLDKTIVLKSEGIKPSEGDLLRVQYVANDSVYLCIID
ncbi:hypothetical protein UFOVP532_7 [uncultured Caudovirales phage]|uniref:Uncharacterized protein n=1 Tax=uncultured Caudovirales phage TaxID=2100421 RepID=A0A6J5MRJ3_9CAUD|nr:hypothetical protein UFOVP532_7 [uncultured Caudovirales phage]